MAKYLRQKPKKRLKHPLLLAMTIYAGLFLGAAVFGLNVFWKYIDAYEASRPKNTIDAYMEQLTAEHICDQSGDLIDSIDHVLQSEAECREKICAVVESGMTYAKKSSASDDTKTVYVLRCGSQVIGSVTMTAAEVDEYGFTHWQVGEEAFDFSFLIGKADTVTVPSDYPVYYNGVLLDERYMTETDLRYDALDVFYGDYALPTMVTYAAGPVLGEAAMAVTDPDGGEVVIDENTDYNAFLSNCTADETQALDTFARDFVKRYVAFTGSANKTSKSSYDSLIEYVVPDSDLHTRMKLALDGLAWAQSQGDKVVSITVNRLVNIGGGKYICDVTYEVDTSGREGVVRTTNNAKFVIVDSGTGYQVELLISY